MTVDLDVRIDWAGADTYRTYNALMPLVFEAYAEMYDGKKDEAQHIPLDQFCTPKGRLTRVRIADDLVGMGGWSWVRYLGKQDYPEDWWEDTAELKRVFVRKEFRGRGLGRALNEAIIADARAHGVKRLVAETGAPQVEAIALYGSLGFDQIEPFGHIVTGVESNFFGMDLR